MSDKAVSQALRAQAAEGAPAGSALTDLGNDGLGKDGLASYGLDSGGGGMIDWERVAILRDEVGEEGFSMVVELFLDEVDEAVADLPRVAAAQLQAALHFLKGGALNLGFHDLAVLCAAAEGRAALERPVELGPILTAYNLSRAEFLAGLGPEGGQGRGFPTGDGTKARRQSG